VRSALPLFASDLDRILQHTAPFWEEVRGNRIFLTGGTGFFGCWLVESFCHINHQLGLDASLTVLTRDPAAFSEKCPHLVSDSAITLHQGDVRNFAFPPGEFSHIIHAATDTTGQTAIAPLELLSTILAGTERTLQFAVACGARKFLLTSSGAVYGKQPSTMTHVPETWTGAPDPLAPASAYAEGKRAAELLCALSQQSCSLECKIARCWAFCGPRLPLDQHFAIGNFIGDVLANRPIHIHGDGTPRRSYLYAADLAIWLWTILFRAPALTPINVGSDHDVSILELAQRVAAILSPGTEIRVAHEPLPGAAPIRYVPSIDRARELLSLQAVTPLEEAIRMTAAWYRQGAPE
jgi:nucleoside-diphosphate-sugar epimerase